MQPLVLVSLRFATGVIIISLINSTTDLHHILFGNLLAITRQTFWTTIIIGVIVILLIVILYRPLMISTFDATFSRVSGLNTTMIHYFIMLLLALVTVASIQTVGIILVVALLLHRRRPPFNHKESIFNDDRSKFNRHCKFYHRIIL